MLNLTDLMYSVHSFFFGNSIKDILKHTSNKNKIILDIGCYNGWFTKKMIIEEKKLNLYSKYYLFDPNPKSKLYLTNLMASNKNIEYFDIAIDNENSKKTFYLNNFFAPAGSSLGNVLKNDKKWNLSRRIFIQFFKMFKLEKIKDFSEFEINTFTLDSFCKNNNIKKIDILKIDVEGTELDILEGAKELMSMNLVKVIYTEIIDRKKIFQKIIFRILLNLEKKNILIEN